MGRWRRRQKHSTSQHTSPGRQVSFGVGSTAAFDGAQQRPRGDGQDPTSGVQHGGEYRTTRRKTSSKKNYKCPPFRDTDIDRIRMYLEEYRDRADRLNFPEDGVRSPKGGQVVSKVGNGDSEETDSYAKPVQIAEHSFPALDEAALAMPYLDLPSSLSSKQRKAVHELCVDVGLFHSGAGQRDKDRRVVISIHCDGLAHVPCLSTPVSIPVKRCMPWYYRNDHISAESIGKQDVEDEMHRSNSFDTPIHANLTEKYGDAKITELNRAYVKEATRRGKEKIEALVDQPGRCLRNAHDSIDFKELEGLDLSTDPFMSCLDEDDDNWLLVDTPEKMYQCVKEIEESHTSELGFDLEMYNQSKYTQATCLLQLSTDQGRDYVVDTLAPGVWDAMSFLAPIFADQTIVKIGHSVSGMDIPSLHRDFGIVVVNCFDTYEASKALRIKELNLAALCRHYGLQASEEYAALKAEYQNTDWRRRPLTGPMLKYGRCDAHFLVKLRQLLIRDLTRARLWDISTMDEEEEARIVARALAATLRSVPSDENEEETASLGQMSRRSSAASNDDGYFTPDEDSFDDAGEEGGSTSMPKRRSFFTAKDLRMHAVLMQVISRSQEACLRLWTDPQEQAMKHDAFISVIKQSAFGMVQWEDSHTALYEKLVQWRKSVANREGTTPGAVCSLDLLVHVARKRPTCSWTLRRLEYFLPALLGEGESVYSSELLRIVRSASIEAGVGGDSATVVRSYSKRTVRTTARCLDDSNASTAPRGGHNVSSLSTSDRANGTASDKEIALNSVEKESDEDEQTSFSTWMVKMAAVAAVAGVVAIVLVTSRKRKS